MKVFSFRKFKAKSFRGAFNIFNFFSRGEGGGGEQAFVVVIKHLIDFDGHKLSRLSGWVCFLFHKNEHKDRTTGCVSITSDKFTSNELDQGKVR